MPRRFLKKAPAIICSEHGPDGAKEFLQRRIANNPPFFSTISTDGSPDLQVYSLFSKDFFDSEKMHDSVLPDYAEYIENLISKTTRSIPLRIMPENIFGKNDDLESILNQLTQVINRLAVVKEECNNALNNGDTQRADQYFVKITELYDECVDLSRKYFIILLDQDNPQHGLDELENIREIIQSTETFFSSPVYDDVRTQNFHNLEVFKACFLFQLQKYRRALKSCETILGADGTRDEIWVLKGNTLIELGDPDGAFEAFETAIGLEWHNADAWVGLGLVYQESELYQKALEAFETALEIDDSNPDAIKGRDEIVSRAVTERESPGHEKTRTEDAKRPSGTDTRETRENDSTDNRERKVFRKPAKQNKEDTISRGFASVAGMNEIKTDLIKDIIEPLRRKEEAKKFGVRIPNGFLFFGPPGCGKTFIVRKLAEEIGYNYQEFSASDVGSKWAHETSGNIAKIFEDAKNNAPTILFFDEIEALVPKRESLGSEQWKQEENNEFLTQMNNASENEVLVIGATNKPDMIDDAVLRSGRMDKRIYIRPPDTDARKDLFNKQLEARVISRDIDLAELAALTENYASSDIALVVNNAARTAFSEGYAEINQDLLKYCIENTPSSLTRSQISAYEKFKNYIRK